MLLHGHNHLFHGQLQLAGGALHDADIGLMGHQPVNISLGLACFHQHSTRRLFQHADRQLEHCLTIHGQHG